MKKFIYYPFKFRSFENPYCSNFVSWIEDLGLIDITPERVRGFNVKNIFKRNETCAFVNWLDNELVSKKGEITLKGFVKALLMMILFRLFCKKVFFVKHNNYPHSTKLNHAGIVKFLVSVLERLATKVIIHDESIKKKNYVFVPHPLYSECYDEIDVNIVGDYFSYFGRIDAYKSIVELVNKWPDSESPLYIIGTGKDKKYVNKVKEAARNKLNVFFVNKRLSDGEAGNFIKSSKALIIPNQGLDMIVSGVVYFGITYKVPIIGFDLEHIKYLSDKFPAIFYSIDGKIESPILLGHENEGIKKCYEEFYKRYYSSNPLKVLGL
ncbi:hypothetical protein Q8W30_05635 [Neptunomonas phycophila]|uniref:Glycosyl transferase family 1 domain-containing protein n=1 Tax=Neptunomonas phycophila TaxID=1572645 RepID=A0ABT9ESL0_9GAMM|nr:hypothetical protein [Neptunomonas phycophila]MDP2522049.1 hypothetical protein [Neptunomonas phycophila]